MLTHILAFRLLGIVDCLSCERGLVVIISAFINGQHHQIHDSEVTNLVGTLGIFQL